MNKAHFRAYYRGNPIRVDCEVINIEHSFWEGDIAFVKILEDVGSFFKKGQLVRLDIRRITMD